ncbi:MAG: radical SAM protein [Chloroflexi bacterium RBG_16_56_11]|nr:MAG: radical SAM protein [Chloroflexi bacterium RBG_16_56_11]
MSETGPGYLALYRSGELERRVKALEARLEECDICPRECRTRRLEGNTGACNSGALPIVSSFCAHHGEEPALSGSRGSGTIFFGNCNMRCVYCQNFQISQDPVNQRQYEVTTRVLAERMLYLQDELKCHNINLVTPSHFVPQIARAVFEAVPRGLRLPLVYNTSSYDSLRTLKQLDGIIDIYLADLRYASNEAGRRYSGVPDYTEISRAGIKEMYRQVGDLLVDEEGVAIKGLMVRHLILPNGIAGSEESLRWLAREVSPRVAVSIMSQYYPAHLAYKYRELYRKILPAEYDEVARLAEELGMENGWLQEMESAGHYRPDFAADEPFAKKEEGESGR